MRWSQTILASSCPPNDSIHALGFQNGDTYAVTTG
jgi:hypothetical protein